ncbi:site-specific recombinase, phage integrase family [Ancylostoma ceylanicum]|uniref:Site-specific recombinase, phage integrase family n=1 Tax=Ancylostoma ceylanicum TaxID=53326 RepID=A0A0D6M1L0_9BILA|nr:site-specific recombinase, phage integrase family [Ancylostoma ceylanicum]
MGREKETVGATAILLMFAAFLRISELCHLRFSDISFQGEDVWWLRVRKSKTDQRGNGTTIAFRLDGQGLRLWNDFKNLHGFSAPEDFIFSCRTGGPPSRDFISRRLKKTLTDAGLAHRRLTSHSFRGGAATTAIRAGADPANVMRVGRWKSRKSFLSYVNLSPL